MSRKNETCSVGDIDGCKCENLTKKNLHGPLQLVKIKDLDDDISELFRIKNQELSYCDYVTYKESWLIAQRVGAKLCEESDVCQRHRTKYGKSFQSKNTCKYPGHTFSKKKVPLKPISVVCAYQAEALFGSAAKKVSVPIGSGWCSACRNLHSKMMTENESMFNELCKVCFQSHENR